MQGQLDAHQFTRALEPWSTGRSYLNFAENEVDARTGYTESAWLQLKGIRSAYDPDDRFVANHRVPRLFENGRVTRLTRSKEQDPSAGKWALDRRGPSSAHFLAADEHG